jgi:hypothetical protein
MMMETGMKDGVPYKVMRAPIREVLQVPIDAKWWHLWTRGEYQGHFKTKREALAHVS